MCIYTVYAVYVCILAQLLRQSKWQSIVDHLLSVFDVCSVQLCSTKPNQHCSNQVRKPWTGKKTLHMCSNLLLWRPDGGNLLPLIWCHWKITGAEFFQLHCLHIRITCAQRLPPEMSSKAFGLRFQNTGFSIKQWISRLPVGLFVFTFDFPPLTTDCICKSKWNHSVLLCLSHEAKY